MLRPKNLEKNCQDKKKCNCQDESCMWSKWNWYPPGSLGIILLVMNYICNYALVENVVIIYVIMQRSGLCILSLSIYNEEIQSSISSYWNYMRDETKMKWQTVQDIEKNESKRKEIISYLTQNARLCRSNTIYPSFQFFDRIILAII